MSDTTLSKRDVVKNSYADIANGNMKENGEGGTALSEAELRELAASIGYSAEDLSNMDGANLGLGCGNPLALQQIRRGDVVLDLGSGAGFDALLAADKVGMTGLVIGVDMTEEMVEKAQNNARKRNFKNIVFRQGVIEDLPVGDNSVDVILSNCVINLSQDKQQVFREAYRVLKPGGILAISDIALNVELPQTIKDSAAMYAGCISGAILKQDYIDMVKSTGFENVRIEAETNALSLVPQELLPKLAEQFAISGDQMQSIPADSVVSVYLKAEKSPKKTLNVI
jgi:SAM-dependent methyltransferase